MDADLKRLVDSTRRGHPTIDFAAGLIAEGLLVPHLLSDRDFQRIAANVFGVPPGKISGTGGLRRPSSPEFFVRAGSPTLASDAVHEAAHYLDDFLLDLSPSNLRVALLEGRYGPERGDVEVVVRWGNEVRAFLLEHAFPRRRGVQADFPNVEAIVRHVETVYAARRPQILPPGCMEW